MELMLAGLVRESYAEIESEICNVYFDISPSCHEGFLSSLLSVAPLDHILFGKDLPYAPKTGVLYGREEYAEGNLSQKTWDIVNHNNAKILPMFRDAP
ncbi:uncharacterized protein Z518_00893 [Rhinocladiella mackenziei CBS 650.93]|uniref:Amidohydrolase-related domain-containing protein n=1 Tax=Rhinocladiella mackenziei CBS 650.93 TaxID=1442369 RepID=A0A0D2G4Z1_9EURO|nr:uncharacterized protein Z518_00893 [Rhinocladiella mackenziei CBS 650.93]KIX09812.1 hypothetical protein Z518_00893 [Rhinocladiella mackenziei CBS 650.93]